MLVRFIFIFLSISCFAGNEIIVINDNGFFNKSVVMDTEGFAFFTDGIWTQTGANYNTEMVLTFWDNYSPIIKNVGNDKITLEFRGCSWWPNPFASESISCDAEMDIQVKNQVIGVKESIVEDTIFGHVSGAGLGIRGTYGSTGSRSENLDIKPGSFTIEAMVTEAHLFLNCEGLSDLGHLINVAGFIPTIGNVFSGIGIAKSELEKWIKEQSTYGTKKLSFTPDSKTIIPPDHYWEIEAFYEGDIVRHITSYHTDTNEDGIAESVQECILTTFNNVKTKEIK